MTPRILIIAGSDSGGGAGIQADIKTVTMLGGHAMTAVTAITAQNTLDVDAVHLVPAGTVIAQIDACLRDIGVDAIKIGMIGSAETAHAVADFLQSLQASSVSPSDCHLPPGGRNAKSSPPGGGGGEADGGGLPIVFDPVMVATSGATLADTATIAAFDRLAALAAVVTPNLPELAALGGADRLAQFAPVLVKGGHGEGDVLVDRLVTTRGELARWSDTRIETTSTHGTGCTLASAVAVGLAEGMPLVDAVARARRFVRTALERAPGLGQGHGPMGHQFVDRASLA